MPVIDEAGLGGNFLGPTEVSKRPSGACKEQDFCIISYER